MEAGEEGSRDGDGDGAERARAERAKTRAARNAVKGGRAAPPAMMPAVFDDAMSMSFDEDEDEVDEEEARRLKSVLSKRQAHLSLSVELARAELEAAQKKFEKAQLQLERFNEIISN